MHLDPYVKGAQLKHLYSYRSSTPDAPRFTCEGGIPEAPVFKEGAHLMHLDSYVKGAHLKHLYSKRRGTPDAPKFLRYSTWVPIEKSGLTFRKRGLSFKKTGLR